MVQLSKILVAGGTFSVALGIGFVMQNGDALADRMTAPEVETLVRAEAAPSPPRVPGHPLVNAGASLLSIIAPPSLATVSPDFMADLAIPTGMTAPDLPKPPVELAALETEEPVSDAPGLSVQADCAPALTGTAAAAAIVDLVLAAPCAPDAVVTIHHQGMMFSAVTDADGVVSLSVPALSAAAVFIADMGGEDGAVAVVTVPDIAMYDRAVLQWRGKTGLEIHAREFGAGYADEGHVWSGAARDPDAIADGAGGFVTRLGDTGGDAGLRAEVYTFPTGMGAASGEVDLTVEAEVLAETCGTDIAAQTIQVSPGSAPRALDLTMTLPDCDAVGEFLVLNNMLTDLTLAAR